VRLTDLHGRTLVQLSALHVGPQVDDGYVLQTFATVGNLAPDIVVYTGDFTSYQRTLYAHVERVYAHSARGRLATLGILGNHDYGPGWAHPEIAARLVQILRDAGITVLRNQVGEVAELQIAGMDDLWAGRFDPRETLRSLDARRPALALSHNPDGRSRWVAGLPQLGVERSYARRPVQGAVPAASAHPCEEPALHVR